MGTHKYGCLEIYLLVSIATNTMAQWYICVCGWVGTRGHILGSKFYSHIQYDMKFYLISFHKSIVHISIEIKDILLK